MVNLCLLSKECAYQRLLRSFGGLATITLEPMCLEEVLRVGILDPRSGYDEKNANEDVNTLVVRFSKLLSERAEMLEEYVSLVIKDKKLCALPNALGIPSAEGLSFVDLPLVLIRLCTEVNWNVEKLCLEGICRIMADLAVSAMLPQDEDISDTEARISVSTAAVPKAVVPALVSQNISPLCFSAIQSSVPNKNASINQAQATQPVETAESTPTPAKKRQRTVEREKLEKLKWLFEAVHSDRHCKWPAALFKGGAFLELVALEQLYRIFERC